MAVGSPKSLAALQTSPRPSGLFVPLGHYLKIKIRSKALSEGRANSHGDWSHFPDKYRSRHKANLGGRAGWVAGGDQDCPSQPQSEPPVPEAQNEQRNRKLEQKGIICMKAWPKRLFTEGKFMKRKSKYLIKGVHFVLFSETTPRLASNFGFPDSVSPALGSQACATVPG